MEPSIVGLVLLSAILHPLWNALIKSHARPEEAFLALMGMFAAFALIHALATGADLLSVVRVWPFVLISAVGLSTYGYNLVLTLKRGDLSAYYPIVRSSPLFIVIVGVLFLGEHYSPFLLAGIGLVVIGALSLQYRPGTRFLDDPATLARAVLAMFGAGVYSITDSRGVRLVEPMVLLFWVQVLVYPTLVLLFHRFGGHRVRALVLGGWRTPPARNLLTGAICYGSYYLILTAYRMGGEVAAVTAVRQASIPLSVLFGGFYFREEGIPRRLLAALILSVGIVVIVLAG